jgi:hypothetical protein
MAYMAYDEGLATRIRDAIGEMKGWLLVAAEGHAEDGDLRRWVDRGVAYAASLPPKAP